MKPTLMRPNPVSTGVSTPVVTPIQQSVVYATDAPDTLDAQYTGQEAGFTYAREGHPNAEALAARIDALEGAEGGLITGSGMAAVMAALMGVCGAGDHIIGGDQLYGRSLRLMTQDLPRFGLECTLVDTTDVDAVVAALKPNTRMILIEVVSNPTLRIADLHGIAELCKDRDVLLVVDNTFTTPRSVKPFESGADIVLHSVTKLLAGHADVTLGYVAARTPELRKAMYDFAVTTGLTPSPFECWLAERGLMTFDLRYDKAQATAQILAEHLAAQPDVLRAIYPSRGDHPDHLRTQSVLGGQAGNMVSFEIKGGRAAANAFSRAAQGVAFAPTLGDVGTTLSHPASSSHRALTPEDRAALGMSEGFFRVSVGLEDPDALMATFDAGLAAVRAL
ncbi:MAG: aminotransferase class I/II-fold pyridoxal phosphate-dependent enzyme [Rhodobacteraceae bacterium]|nr:aminotransferase class I/II-fold pyridoxal phosphate-dependent enzyme [Paracoccaceae bacterium]